MPKNISSIPTHFFWQKHSVISKVAQGNSLFSGILPPVHSLLVILKIIVLRSEQCCGTITIYYGSGSDFWLVTVPTLYRTCSCSLQVVYLYRVDYAESGMLSLAVLVITRALQPAVLASYWTFLFSAQVRDLSCRCLKQCCGSVNISFGSGSCRSVNHRSGRIRSSYLDIFVANEKICWFFINNTDPDPRGQLITDPPDLDPDSQHWLVLGGHFIIALSWLGWLLCTMEAFKQSYRFEAVLSNHNGFGSGSKSWFDS